MYLSECIFLKKKCYYCSWKNTCGAFGCLGIGALFNDDFEGPDSNCTVCVLNLNLDVIGMKST